VPRREAPQRNSNRVAVPARLGRGQASARPSSSGDCEPILLPGRALPPSTTPREPRRGRAVTWIQIVVIRREKTGPSRGASRAEIRENPGRTMPKAREATIAPTATVGGLVSNTTARPNELPAEGGPLQVWLLVRTVEHADRGMQFEVK